MTFTDIRIWIEKMNTDSKIDSKVDSNIIKELKDFIIKNHGNDGVTDRTTLRSRFHNTRYIPQDISSYPIDQEYTHMIRGDLSDHNLVGDLIDNNSGGDLKSYKTGENLNTQMMGEDLTAHIVRDYALIVIERGEFTNSKLDKEFYEQNINRKLALVCEKDYYDSKSRYCGSNYYESSGVKLINRNHLDSIGGIDNILGCIVTNYDYLLFYLPTLEKILFRSYYNESSYGSMMHLKNESTVLDYDELIVQDSRLRTRSCGIRDVGKYIEEINVILPASPRKKKWIYKIINSIVYDYVYVKDLILLIVDCLLGDENVEKFSDLYKMYVAPADYIYKPFNTIHKNSLNHYPLPRFPSDVIGTSSTCKWREFKEAKDGVIIRQKDNNKF